MPLRELIAGNLRDAHKLGMIECEKDAIEEFLANVCVNWNRANDGEYADWMRNLKNQFDQSFRPIQAFKGRTIPFCNVMQLGVFSNRWLANFPIIDPEVSRARDKIAKLATETVPASKTSLGQLHDSLLRLNQWFRSARGGRSRGVSIPIRSCIDTATRPFWIGGRVNKPVTSAQYWRDRLGLIQLSAPAGSCQDCLVRLRFITTLSDDILPRDGHIEHSRRNKESLWVIRPGVVHEGNERFVQGVSADRTTRPSRRGSTRDISSDKYLEGEREMLLLTGEIGQVRLIAIDLLDDFPRRNVRDDNDHGFVKSISHQLGW